MIQHTCPIVKLNMLESASIPEESADLFLGIAIPNGSMNKQLSNSHLDRGLLPFKVYFKVWCNQVGKNGLFVSDVAATAGVEVFFWVWEIGLILVLLEIYVQW